MVVLQQKTIQKWNECQNRTSFRKPLHFISSKRCMTDGSRNNIVFLPNASFTQPEVMPQKFHRLCTLLLTYREANSHFNLKFFVIFIKTVKMGTNLLQKGRNFQIQPPDHNKSNKNH